MPMKTPDDHLDRFISAQWEHTQEIKKLKTPFEKTIEEFRYNKEFLENIENFRALLLKEEFDEILPTLLFSFDLYGKY